MRVLPTGVVFDATGTDMNGCMGSTARQVCGMPTTAGTGMVTILASDSDGDNTANDRGSLQFSWSVAADSAPTFGRLLPDRDADVHRARHGAHPRRPARLAPDLGGGIRRRHLIPVPPVRIPGLWRSTSHHNTSATSARPMGMPGCPLLARSTASIASARMAFARSRGEGMGRLEGVAKRQVSQKRAAGFR